MSHIFVKLLSYQKTSIDLFIEQAKMLILQEDKHFRHINQPCRIFYAIAQYSLQSANQHKLTSNSDYNLVEIKRLIPSQASLSCVNMFLARPFVPIQPKCLCMSSSNPKLTAATPSLKGYQTSQSFLNLIQLSFF